MSGLHDDGWLFFFLYLSTQPPHSTVQCVHGRFPFPAALVENQLIVQYLFGGTVSAAVYFQLSLVTFNIPLCLEI